MPNFDPANPFGMRYMDPTVMPYVRGAALDELTTMELAEIVNDSRARKEKKGLAGFLYKTFDFMYADSKEAERIIEERKQARINFYKAKIKGLEPFDSSGDLYNILEMYQDGTFDTLLGHHVTIEQKMPEAKLFNSHQVAGQTHRILYEPVAEKPSVYSDPRNRGLVTF